MKKLISLGLCIAMLASAMAMTAVANDGTETKYTAVACTFYDQPNLSSAQIQQVPAGTSVITYPGEGANGFTKCFIGSRFGYIVDAYLTNIANANYGGGSQNNLNGTWNTQKVISQTCSLYASPNSSAKVVATIPAKTPITITTVTDGWAAAIYGSSTGYVKTCYIEGWNTPQNYPANSTSWYGGYDWSAVYDYSYYRANNPDVVNALGNSPEACISHFVNNGMNEGRAGSASFNVCTYMTQHPELVAVYGYTNPSIYYKYACGIPLY